jgi:tripartite-type tricarboxylate transporter receptor subunit TctC
MRLWLKMFALVCAFAASAVLAAEGYPVRPVRWIVPAPPGGGTDAVGRIVGAKLAEFWGQQIVIDNRGGAQGGLVQ